MPLSSEATASGGLGFCENREGTRGAPESAPHGKVVGGGGGFENGDLAEPRSIHPREEIVSQKAVRSGVELEAEGGMGRNFESGLLQAMDGIVNLGGGDCELRGKFA
jgi:hypothetical protein